MNWLAFFLMLPHLKPKCLDILNPTLYRNLDLLRILSLAVICALFLRAFIKSKKLPSPPSILLGVMEVWILLVTLITHGDYVEVCSIAVSVMAIVLLVDLYSDQMKKLLAALMLNYEWMVYANLWLLWKFPKGVARDPDYGNMRIYFFGPDNWFMFLLIPAVCVALLYLRTHWRGWSAVFHIPRALCLVAACYVTIYLARPVTTVVAMAILAAVLVVGLILGLIPGIRLLVSAPVVFLSGISANLAIAVYRVMENIPFLTNFIESKLGKDVTLHGRTGIWIWFVEQFRNSPWLGIGNPVEGYLTGKTYKDHLHNQYFDLLALGGIPALALFLAALTLIVWMLTRHHKTLSARIITACMAALLVICIPEACRHGSIFLLFPLAWHVCNIEDACPIDCGSPSENSSK